VDKPPRMPSLQRQLAPPGGAKTNEVDEAVATEAGDGGGIVLVWLSHTLSLCLSLSLSLSLSL
jgi:hypothetical protein